MISKLRFQNFLNTHRFDHNIITIIPTWYAFPTPYVYNMFPRFKEENHPDLEDRVETEESWMIINKKFADLGVKKFFLAGEYLIVGPPQIPPVLGGGRLRPANPLRYLKQRYSGDESRAVEIKHWLNGCLAVAADYLSDSFKVKMLPATYPATEKDLRLLEKMILGERKV